MCGEKINVENPLDKHLGVFQFFSLFRVMLQVEPTLTADVTGPEAAAGLEPWMGGWA